MRIGETSVRLVLHLGAHRTGTTALQARFAEARKKAAGTGVRFWGPKFVRTAIDPAVARATRPGKGGAKALAEVVSIRTELDVALHEMDAEGADTLLISDENLLGTMRRNFIEGALYPDTVARLQRLSELLPEVPERIYLSIRDYAEFWASSYAFAALRNSLDRFDALRPDLLDLRRDWPDVISEISAVFPDSDVRIWPYSSEEDALEGLIADMIGPDRLARLGPARKPRRNRGLPHGQVTAALTARANDPQLGVRALQEAASEAAPNAKAAFMPFTPDERAALSARYGQDLTWLGEDNGVATLVSAKPATQVAAR